MTRPQPPILTDAAITALARLLLKRSAELDAEPMPEPLGTIAPKAAAEILGRTAGKSFREIPEE